MGLLTSSPPQLGHVAFISPPHFAQNVHSKLQMTASVEPGGSSVPHFSQAGLISSIP